MPSSSSRLVRSTLTMAALAAATLSVGTAQAGISSVNTFRNNVFTQTGNGNSLTVTGAFFSAGLTSTGSNDYTSVQMTYPGSGSPVSLTQQDPTDFLFQTGFLTKPQMDTLFPTGMYTFNASGSSSASTNFTYSGDDYSQTNPFLTGTDYTALQGMNASSAFTFHFSPYTTGSQATSSFIFLTIFDTTTSTFVFSSGFLSASTTSLTLPANTLQASHSYTYELDYSNRDTVSSPGTVFSAQIGFDTRTDGTFTTATPVAPEPGSLALLAPALGTLAMVIRRRQVGAGLFSPGK